MYIAIRLVRIRSCSAARRVGSGVVAALLAWGSSSEAATQFRVPQGCGSAAEFTSELERLLGGDALHAAPSSLEITEPDATGSYRLHLRLTNEQRELTHTDCRTLFRSSVVVTAAAFRRDHPPEPEPARAPMPPPIAAAPLEPSEVWRAGATIGAGAGVGLLPNAAPLVELGALVERGHWQATASLRYLSPNDARLSTGHGVSVWAAGARALVGFEPVPAAMVGVGAGVYRLEGQGLGGDQQLSDRVWALAPYAELTAFPLQLQHLRLELGVEAEWCVVRPRFVIDGFGEVYRVRRFGAAGIFRATWLFR